MVKAIINADDFGSSHGVNMAICQAHHKGIVNSTSLMVNLNYAKEAVELAKNMPHLNIGLHLNLTNETSVSNPQDIPLLINKDGKFSSGFLKLLLLTLLHPKAMQKQIRCEVEAQINKAQKMGVELTHIDGHRHIHTIPLIFKIVCELQQKYNIKRVRVINENLFMTLKLRAGFSFLFDGGIIKYTVLKVLSWFNHSSKAPYFFSILYTGKITPEKLCKFLSSQLENDIEVMVHPNLIEIDKADNNSVFDENLLSPYRTQELEAVCDENCKKELMHYDYKTL